MESIKIESGAVEVPIQRDGVITGAITVNAKDTLFMERFYLAFQNITRKLDTYKTDEAPEVEQQFAIIKEVNAYMREQIDYAFGAGTSDIVFGATVSYDFGIYSQFLDGIKPIIEPARKSALSKYIPPSQKPAKGARKPRKR